MDWTAATLKSFRTTLGLTLEQLGERLAPHRPGRFEGKPYSRAFLSAAEKGKEAYWNGDFVQTLNSYLETVNEKSDKLRTVGVDLETVMDLIGQGRLYVVGEGELIGVIGYAKLAENEAIHVNGGAPCVMTPIVSKCAFCGRPIALRSTTHKWCAEHADARDRVGPLPQTPERIL